MRNNNCMETGSEFRSEDDEMVVRNRRLTHTKVQPVIGDQSEKCGVMIGELFLPVSSAQESNGTEI